jgi:hypothetical protein
METAGMVERIRSLLARFSEDENVVRQLVATDPGFDALCNEYRQVVKLLASFDTEVRRLTQMRASLEEELLTRIEGHRPQ